MKKLTLRIIIAAFIAALFSTIGMVFMGSALGYTTKSYSEFLNVYISRKNTIAQIGQNIYHAQSLTSMHILSDDEENLAEYEKELEKIISATEKLMTELGNNVENAAEKELVHTISADFYGFSDCVDVVTDLSRKNRKETADYYFSTQMRDYVHDANENLSEMTDSISLTIEQREEELSSFSTLLNIIIFICIGVSVIVEIICVLTVILSGREIEDVQSEEQKNHQLAYIELQNKVINGMANLIESRDTDTGEHVKRTSTFVEMIALELRRENIYTDTLTDSYIENLVKAAPLHDVGKIRITDAILQKKGKLTPEEFDIMKTHSALGGQIVNDILGDIEEKSYIQIAFNIATYHHEKWNGCGYPEQLKGEQIPLEARIMAVADVFDALISKRCYKLAISADEAYKIIAESSGSHFDPKIAEAFLSLKGKINEYMNFIEE